MWTRMLAALAALTMWAAAAQAAGDGPVLVFGGTTGVGLEAVKLLRADGRQVTVFVRPTSNLDGLQPLGVDYVVGDALNMEDVEAAFASGTFDAAISSLGGRRGEPRPDYIGNRNITDAAKATGVRRVIQVSANGVADAPTEPPPPDAFMPNVFYEKKRGEDYLIASGLDWTIIRPVGLRDGPATGTGQLLPPDSGGGVIMRADVGRLVVESLDDPITIGRIYNANDPELPAEPVAR